MADNLQRVISDRGDFFGIACNTTSIVAEACRRHDCGPTAAAALGRAITGAVLMAALLKDRQSVLLKFEGGGPLGKVIAEAGSEGWARGYVADPHGEVPLHNGTIDVAGGIGHAGFLTVVKNIGRDRKYPGTIQLVSSEIGEDLAYYLTQSEQTPSTLGLTVHLQASGVVAAAGGFLVQSLPPADEHSLSVIEEQIDGLPPLSGLFAGEGSAADVLTRIFKKVPHHQTGGVQLQFQCGCSLQKMKAALLSLGREDLNRLLTEQEETEVRCEFCRDIYRFRRQDLAELLAASQESVEPRQQ